MRRYRSRSRALWWVVNGRDPAPPASDCRAGVSISTKSRSASHSRIAENDLVAGDEQLASVFVGEQVELAVAVARARVAQPVVLVGGRAERLGQQRALDHRERELAALGDVHAALDPDDVADVQVQDAVVGLLPEGVNADDRLDRPGQVAHVQERRLAVSAPGDQPAGDVVAQLGMFAGLELGRGRAPRARRRCACACPTALPAGRGRCLRRAAAPSWRAVRRIPRGYPRVRVLVPA